MAAIEKKFEFLPTAENLRLFRRQEKVPDSISNKKLKELMVIDDWATIASVAMPFI